MQKVAGILTLRVSAKQWRDSIHFHLRSRQGEADKLERQLSLDIKKEEADVGAGIQKALDLAIHEAREKYLQVNTLRGSKSLWSIAKLLFFRRSNCRRYSLPS